MTVSKSTTTKFWFALGFALLTSLSIAMKAWQYGMVTPQDITEIATAIMGAGAVWLAPNALKGVTSDGSQPPSPTSGSGDTAYSSPYQPGAQPTQPIPGPLS